MSVKLMSMVFDARLSPTQKLVMLALADHATDDGKHIYPGRARIIHKTGLGETAVRETIRGMTNMGLLILVKRSSLTTSEEYNIDLDTLARLSQPFKKSEKKAETNDESGAPGGPGSPHEGGSLREGGAPGEPGEVRQVDHPGAPDGPGEVHVAREGGSPGGPQPSLTIIKPSVTTMESSGQKIPSFQEAWQMILPQLALEMKRAEYTSWVEPLQPIGFEDGIYCLAGMNSIGVTWVKQRLGAKIAGLLSGVLMTPVRMEFTTSILALGRHK